MKHLSEVRDRELKWIQPQALKQEFELRAGDEVVATLRFKSSFGSLATAESADGCWTFKRVGFWHPRVTIRVCGDDTDIAVFKNRTWNNGGTLEFPDGRRYLADLNFWATRYELTTETDEVLLRYTSIGGFAHFSAKVDVLPDFARQSEMPWLIMLGWYLRILVSQDSAAAVAATTAAH
jgi:hypothetical protein